MLYYMCVASLPMLDVLGVLNNSLLLQYVIQADGLAVSCTAELVCYSVCNLC